MVVTEFSGGTCSVTLLRSICYSLLRLYTIEPLLLYASLSCRCTPSIRAAFDRVCSYTRDYKVVLTLTADVISVTTRMWMMGCVLGLGARVVSSPLRPHPFTLTLAATPSQHPTAANMRLLKLSRTSRRALPGLNALKTALELLSKAGCAVPPLQAVADTSLKIIEYAEVRPFPCFPSHKRRFEFQ